MERRFYFFVMLLSLAVLASPLTAQDLTGEIVSVRGMVQVRGSVDAPWQMAQKGAAVNAGTEFRTGPRSSVVFRIEPNQVVTLDRLGVMKIDQAVRLASGQVKTDLSMPYGRNNYKIEGGGVEHESTIRTPAAVLGVRGSEMSTWHDFDTGSRSKEHSADFKPRNKNNVKLPQDMQVDEKSPDAGSVSKEKETVDTDNNQRTDEERGLIVNRPNGNFQTDQNNKGYRPQDDHHDRDHPISSGSNM